MKESEKTWADLPEYGYPAETCETGHIGRMHLIDQYKLCMYYFCMSQKTSTVNISFREDLLNEIDEVARTESRSRSELVREAARLYIERKKRLKSMIESMRQIASERGITAKDVQREIASYRAEKKSKR